MVDALARNGDMPAAERLLDRATELAAKQGGWRQGWRPWLVEPRLACCGVLLVLHTVFNQFRVLVSLPSRPTMSTNCCCATLHPLPAGLPPPVEAFGAVVAGYARQLSVGPAFAAVKRFHAAGGSPDAQVRAAAACLCT